MTGLNFTLNKKTFAFGVWVAAAGAIFFIVIMPMFARAGRLSSEAKALDSELSVIREALDRSKKIPRRPVFLTRNDISRAIDEITTAGSKLNINFVSTSPQAIRQSDGEGHPVLPIRMTIQSGYEDLGRFLGALERLDKSIVTVSEFTTYSDPAVLPRLITEMTVEIHLEVSGRG